MAIYTVIWTERLRATVHAAHEAAAIQLIRERLPFLEGHQREIVDVYDFSAKPVEEKRARKATRNGSRRKARST